MADQKLIPSMDLKLKRWAEYYSVEELGCMGSSGNVIASLIASGGELIRCTNPETFNIPDDVYDFGRLIDKLPVMQKSVVKEHYLNTSSLEAQRLAACDCSRRTYFRRLASAHASLVMLSPRKKLRKERGFAREAIQKLIATA